MWTIYSLSSLDLGGNYFVYDALNPMYFEADFNGKGQIDIAIFIYDHKSKKKGILIHHQEDESYHILGAGQLFNNYDNLDWVDVWTIYRSKIAYRTTFKENGDIDSSVKVELTNISIYVAASEQSGNLITWNGNRYEWVHTGE